MSNSQQQPKNQLTLEKNIETFRSDFDKLVRLNAPKINIDSNVDFQKPQAETKQLADQLKKQANDVKQTYSSLTDLTQIPIIHHRLLIAREIQSLHALYEKFNVYYLKNINDRTILDIFQFIKIFYKMKGNLEKFSKIVICDKMNKDINDKIQKTEKIIIETIQHIKYENLSITDIFQLIIISSSPEQFLNFLNFLDDKLFEFKDFPKLIEYIQIHHNFHEKIKRIVPIFEKNSLNDFLQNYICSIEKERLEFDNKILSTYQKYLDTLTKKFYTEDIFRKIDQCSQLIETPYFSEEFKGKMNKLIDNLTLFLVQNIYTIKSDNIKYKRNYLEFLVRIMKYIQERYDPKDSRFSKYPQNLEQIFLDDFSSIYYDNSKSSLEILIDISNNSLLLFKSVLEDEIIISEFRQLLINIIDIQLRTIKIILMKRYSRPQVLKNLKHYNIGVDIPKSIDNFQIKNDNTYSDENNNFENLIAITVYSNYHEIIQKSDTRLFVENRKFDSRFCEFCCRIFYDIDSMSSENDFSQIESEKNIVLYGKIIEITNIKLNDLKKVLTEYAKNDYIDNKKDKDKGSIGKLFNKIFK